MAPSAQGARIQVGTAFKDYSLTDSIAGRLAGCSQFHRSGPALE